jgi:hypothetical protein
VRDLDDFGGYAMVSHHRRGCGIMDDYHPGLLGNSAQHRIAEVTAVTARSGAIRPESCSEIARPFSVIEREFVDVRFSGKIAERKMLQYGIVKHDHAWTIERSLIYGCVKLVIADVIKIHISVTIHSD